jgi:hypothetical protein
MTTTHHPRRRTDAQSVTSAPESRSEDQARRLRRYLVTMGIRTVCFVLVVVVDSWLRWVFAAAAVFLPFIAVVAANAVRPAVRGRVQPVVPVADPTPLLGDRPWETDEHDDTPRSA